MTTNNNIQTPSEKTNDEDSLISSSTSISTSESIIQDITKNKNIFIITKNIEQRIIEILSYLQSDSNLATNKILILKYLQSLFISIEFNSEIFSRKFIKEKEKLNIYKIIINQYIFYSNPANTKIDEENYRSDLQSLFLLLLSQVTLEKDTYHYILSFLINYLTEKNNSKKINNNNNFIENDSIINLKSEHLERILFLLKYFYGYHKNEQSTNGILNYLFFSGDSESNVIIHNKESSLDFNKKILNFDETLCIMIFIRVLPSEYIKAVYPKINFRLLEIKFTDKKNTINFNINIENQIISQTKNEPICQLKENETNCILFKFTKKKNNIFCEIQNGFNKVESLSIQLKDKNNKIKEEIKDIILFKNFIGTCSNIIIYKEKKNEGLPKFLLNEENNNNKLKNNSLLFPNGIYNEELYSYFIKAELLENNMDINKSQKINYNNFKDFYNNNLIAIYIPTRYYIPNQFEDKNITNTPQLILVDSINNLNAEFNTRTPALNGIHIFNNLYENDLNIIGGINNLLPILELILDNKEFQKIEIFSSFFNLLTVYVFSPKYQNALIKENKSDFFKNLSYFLEKMPKNFFNDELAENLKTILGFFCLANDEQYFDELINQINNDIFMNENILLKFNDKNQNNLLNQICTIAKGKNIDIDIIKIIKIMLHYDKDRKYKFCCKEHSNYFNNNNNYEIMEPELSTKLQPLIKLSEIIFIKIYELNEEIFNKNNIINNNKIRKKSSIKNVINTDDNNTYDDKNLFLLFYLLTFDISPCLQKDIIGLLDKLIKKYKYNKFSLVFDKNKELFDIILFVFKNSIFDIKRNALNLMFLINIESNWTYFENKDIKIFIENYILPFFLNEEINELNDLLQNNKNKNEINEICKISDEGKNNTINEIRKNLEINGIEYKLFSLNDIEKKIYNIYDKNKYNLLVNSSFNNIIMYFQYADKVLNFIIKIISNGDLLLISSFLSKILGIIDDPETSKKKSLYYQLIDINFLHFILETYLQFYILKNHKDSNNDFIPGFSLGIFKNSDTSENKKKDKLNKALNDCEKILRIIFNEDITKFDYLLTWGKYYNVLKKENDSYQYVYELIFGLIHKMQLEGKKISTFSEASDINDIKVQNTLYFLSIFFEFFTFYNLEYEERFFYKNEKFLNKIIEGDLKFILFNKKQEKFESNPINEMESVDNKIDNIFFIKNIFSILKPIWSGSDKKLLKNENEVYTKFIANLVNKNLFVNELELLFYTFDDNFFKNKKKEINNKGIPIIYILYHFFICFLNIGGKIEELNDYLKDFRLFLILLITSPSCINLNELAKKKKWLNEEQNEHINKTIEIILFNSVFFFYNKIKEYKRNEMQYYVRIDIEKDDETKKENIDNYNKNIVYIHRLEKLYIENLGYILKILNKIYRDLKSNENQKKGFSLFSNKNKNIEKAVKNTGAFLFINELYNE